MSHYMTALAMRQAGLKPAAKIVLYWLADHHNGETGQCNPSIKRLAECCEMSRRSVENHLQAMQEAGIIQIENCHREKGGKTSNAYILKMSDCDAQNLRMGCAKSAHGDTQNLRMKNLGNNNLGNEQVYSDQTEFGLDDKPPKQKSRLPEGWRPDEEMTEYARSQKLNDDEIQRIADDFFAYWDDQPKSKSSKSLRGWRATWRNRVDSVAWRYVKNRGMAQQPSPGGYGQGGSIASVVARRRLNGEV